jgi:hypothetical protein
MMRRGFKMAETPRLPCRALDGGTGFVVHTAEIASR